jgi:serine/threonine protein kinase
VAIYALKSDDPKVIGDAQWKVLGRLSLNPEKNVFLATSESKKIVIKLLSVHEGGSEDDWHKWGQEVAILQKLDHPHIPKLVDYDFSDTNNPWIATEYVEGQTLEETVEKGNLFKGTDWLNLVSGLAKILKDIHERGIVHRDISPGNILVNDGQPFIIDFGLAQFLDTESNISNAIGATKPTMSPEHLAETLDPRMDLFSLGSTLVYGGTGRYPFDTDTQENLLEVAQTKIYGDWETRILYSRPDLTGLTYSQAKLIKPMLYKKLEDRISSEDLLRSLNRLELAANNHPEIDFSVLRSYLRYGERKLKGRSALYGKKRRLRQIGAASVCSILVIAGITSGQFANAKSTYDKWKISDCIKYLEVGQVNEAIRACLVSVNDGELQASPYLALAYLGKDLKAEAMKVITKCKETDIACKSLYYRNSKDVEDASNQLKKALDSGFLPAAYYLARMYEDNGNSSEALYWIKRGHDLGSKIATFQYVMWMYDQKNYELALNLLLNTNIERKDLVWNAKIQQYDDVIERATVAVLYKSNRESEIERYLTNCSISDVPYCMGELSLYYLYKEQWLDLVKWAQEGANKGDSGAMYALAKYYRHLNGTSGKKYGDDKLEEQISEWTQLSAQSGYLPAIREMWFFDLLKYVNKDDEESLKSACYWYLKGITMKEDQTKEALLFYTYSPYVSFSTDSALKLMEVWNCPSKF